MSIWFVVLVCLYKHLDLVKNHFFHNYAQNCWLAHIFWLTILMRVGDETRTTKTARLCIWDFLLLLFFFMFIPIIIIAHLQLAPVCRTKRRWVSGPKREFFWSSSCFGIVLKTQNWHWAIKKKPAAFACFDHTNSLPFISHIYCFKFLIAYFFTRMLRDFLNLSNPVW